MLFTLISSAFAVGTVNTDASTPFGIVNQAGDALLVGDLKVLIFWKDRTSAFQFLNAKASDLFSGGIADQGSLSAIACSSTETFLFNSTRTKWFPGGEWNRLESGNELRMCSMSSKGDYAMFTPSQNRIVVNSNSLTLNLQGSRNDQYTILSAQNKFFVFCSNGNYQTVFDDKGWKVSGVMRHSFRTSWSEKTRFAAGNSTIDQVTRLPVNPCDDNETCQPGISRLDDSWSVSGYFGHYVGSLNQFTRLTFPLASTGTGGIAFAHQKLGGKFVYLANDDGDIGSLPPSSQSLSQPAMNDKRWFVWSKEGQGIPVKLDRTTKGKDLVLQIYQGDLPDVIPRHWVAYEPERPLDQQMATPSDEFKLPFFKPTDSDELVRSAWWSSNLGVENAWRMVEEAGLKLVKIAVVDTGALTSHPALQKGLFGNPVELDNRQDDDDNGFVDDNSGYDFVLESPKVIDLFGHGTHVTGLLVGHDPTNGVLAPASRNGKVIVLRSLDKSGKSTSIDLARALYYAIEQKVDVINCSWGGGGVTQALKDVFEAIQKANILVFSSAGNDSSNTDPPNTQPVPKLFPGVISVGATTQSGSMGSYSNFGRQTVRFLAPGDKMLSTLKDGSFGELSGTSMASPVAVSTYSWLFGVAKAKCAASKCLKNDIDLRSIVLDIMCKTSNPKAVESRSTCGIINTERATKSLLDLFL